LPAASDAVKPSLEQVKKEAEAVKIATGDWAIVISGDRTLDLAKNWFAGAQKLGYTPVSIYYRDNFYRVTVGNYPTRQEAEQAALVIRPHTRPDAYVVALKRWCPSQSTRKEGDMEVIVCGSE
jgi:septal ring-binding cell division protein DamX